MNGLNAYLLSVSAAALLVNLISNLVPNEKNRKVSLFTGNIILILAILSPLVSFDDRAIENAFRDLIVEAGQVQTKPVFGDDQTMELLIMEQCEAYVLDKARELDADISVTITAERKDGVPYPASALVTGTCSQTNREKLSNILEEDLGIPRWKQEWNGS